MNAIFVTQDRDCGRNSDPPIVGPLMPPFTHALLHLQVDELRGRQFPLGLQAELRSVSHGAPRSRPVAKALPPTRGLKRRLIEVQTQNSSSSGLPSAGAAWTAEDAQRARQYPLTAAGLSARSMRVGLVPQSLLRRREPVEARRIGNKRARARRRQKQHEDRLRASVGEMGILHRLSMGGSEADYRKRADTLWAFMSRHGLSVRPPARLDEALSDYGDWAFLGGEKAEHGEKLKAALAALFPLLMPPGRLVHPLFDRTLRGWRRVAPTFARTGYPEGVSYAISGQLMRMGKFSEALLNVVCFSTYLRPSSALGLRTADLIPPPPGGGSAAVNRWTLLVAPTEREESTKTGDYDMAVVLDDTREPELGQMLQAQAMRMRVAHQSTEEDDDGQVPLWQFTARSYVASWREAVAGLGLQAICTTPYQARHGGPSRDLQSRLRTEAEVAARGWWKTPASVRNYAKPSRMNKVAQQAGKSILEFGESVRVRFRRAILNGTAARLPRPRPLALAS